MREKCIFCNNPLDGSDEHIIPESVNGRLHSKLLICHNCNSNKFGRSIDPVLAEIFKTLLLLLGLKNARPLQLEAPDGRKYIMDHKGKVSQVAPEFSVEKKDGLTYISVSGDFKNTIRKFAKLAAPFWKPGQDANNVKLTKPEDNNPPLRAEFKIEVTDRLILMLNKIILEFHAHNHLDLAIISDLLAKVNKLDLSLDNVIFTNFYQEIREFGNEEISHLLTIRSDGSILYGYVEIFNVICGLIILTENYNGPPIEATYYQDALTGNKLDGPVSLAPALVHLVQTKSSPTSEDFSLLLQALTERHRNQQFQSIFNNMLLSIKEEVLQEIKDGRLAQSQYEAEFVKRSAKGVAYLTVHEFPYILDDVQDENNDMYNYIHSNIREDQYETFYENNKHAIGMRIEMEEGEIYRLESFIKTPVFKRKEVNIIRLHCLLIHEDTGFKKYITLRDLYEGLMRGKEA
jgi:hypothetical protein